MTDAENVEAVEVDAVAQRDAELEAMTVTQLKALPKVAEHEHVKRNRRDDLLAAAKGEMVESEREAAAREQAAAEQEAYDALLKRTKEERRAAAEDA